MERDTEITSRRLTDVLQTFGHFILSDDHERSTQIGRSDVEALTAFADAVDPLLDEINAILDMLVARPHPLSEGGERLEEDLNSLAQAGMEARLELANRSH